MTSPVTRHGDTPGDSPITGNTPAAATANHDLLDGSVHPDTVAGTVVRGDLMIGNATPKWARVAKGANKTYLRSDGTDAAWTALTIVDDTSPKFGGTVDLGSGNRFFIDNNGNNIVLWSAVGSAVNYIRIRNAATGVGPTLQAGGETNVDLLLTGNGTGVVKADGVEVVTLTATQTLTDKTLTTPTIDDLANAQHDHADAAGGGAIPVDNLSDVDTSTDAAALNDVLKWNGSDWVPGTAGDTTEFTFTIDSFSDGISDTSQLIGGGASNPWKALGAVSFTATYSNEPDGMTAEVALSGSATAWAGNLSMTPTTGPETNTEAVEYPATTGGSIVFTLSQSADGTTDTETVAFNNTMRYDTNANGIGAQTDANVEAMTEVAGPNESRSQTINNIPTGTAGHFLSFSYADRLSDVAQVQMNSGFGFVTASFNATATTLTPTIQTANLTAVSNSVNYTEAFAAISSRLANLPNGTNDFKLLTSGTAQNYIFWGELAKASSYTESDVESNTASEPGQVASNSMSSRSMTVNATGSEYTYIAYPARLGALTSIIIGGFESIDDFNVDNTALAITNGAGYQENYRVYVSKNPGFTDPTTMTVTI